MMTNESEFEVIWEPTRRQMEFLSASEEEVLYGGAVGGGKSDALLIDALGLAYGAIENPRHRALILRRTKPELAQLISRSKDLYLQLVPGAKFFQSRNCWEFPSGARVDLDHLRDRQDAERFKGRQWNYIAFDELTHWSESAYTFMHSRLRTPDSDLPCYIRATTNPDGPGQEWVMKRFEISVAGYSTEVRVESDDTTRGIRRISYRRFIAARLDDNPYLCTPEYRARLSRLPAPERLMLLEGQWVPPRFEGAYYRNEMESLHERDRIRDVPYDPAAPVHTFWDLGINDSTAIIFFQYANGEHRFIDCYEASGQNLAHFARVVTTRGYNLGGIHFLPHDAANRSVQTGKTHEFILRELLPELRFEIVPRSASLLEDINATRLKLGGNVYFDAEKTAPLLTAMSRYRKKYDPRTETYGDYPERDKFTHLADALRQWGQTDAFERRTRPRTRASMPRGGWAV